jgi:hypothetical protein
MCAEDDEHSVWPAVAAVEEGSDGGEQNSCSEESQTQQIWLLPYALLRRPRARMRRFLSTPDGRKVCRALLIRS